MILSTLYFNYILLFLIISYYIKNKMQILVFMTIAVIILSILFGNRDGLMRATDLDNYFTMYESMPLNFFDFKFQRIEPLFGFWMIFLKNLGFDKYQFILITSFVFNFLIAISLYKNIDKPLLIFILITVTTIYYNYSANTIREGLSFALFLFFLEKLRKISIKSIIFILIGSMFHIAFLFSSFFLIISQYFKIRIYEYIFFLCFSLIFFLIDIKSLINIFLSLIPQFAFLERTIGIALEYDEQTVSGRINYLISFIVVALSFYNYRLIHKTIIQYNIIKENFYNGILLMSFFVLLTFPLLSSYGYLVRLYNFTFILSNILIYVLFVSLFNRTHSYMLMFLYIILQLFFYEIISDRFYI